MSFGIIGWEAVSSAGGKRAASRDRALRINKLWAGMVTICGATGKWGLIYTLRNKSQVRSESDLSQVRR